MDLKVKTKPILILGSSASFLRDDGLGFYDTDDASLQERKCHELLQQLEIETEPMALIREETDFHSLDYSADLFLVFVFSSEKFNGMELLASRGVPVLLACEEGAPGDALDAYEPLTGYRNVATAFSFEEIRREITAVKVAKFVREAKICLFDSGERTPDGAPWHRNPLISGMLKTELIDVTRFEEEYKKVNGADAEELARSWVEKAEVAGPSFDDITRSAALYLAMRKMIESMNADAAYVLWCSQFNAIAGCKMCLPVAKLNDFGCLTGCWRGENMLPMMILFALSGKPVFFGEVHTFHDKVLAVRHCAVPGSMAISPLILKRWRDKEGTVTGYGELPKGEVTILNSGAGDRMISLKGNVIETRDLGGVNCRVTVYIEIKDDDLVRRFCGREIAMAYGDYVSSVADVGDIFGIKIN